MFELVVAILVGLAMPTLFSLGFVVLIGLEWLLNVTRCEGDDEIIE